MATDKILSVIINKPELEDIRYENRSLYESIFDSMKEKYLGSIITPINQTPFWEKDTGDIKSKTFNPGDSFLLVGMEHNFSIYNFKVNLTLLSSNKKWIKTTKIEKLFSDFDLNMKFYLPFKLLDEK